MKQVKKKRVSVTNNWIVPKRILLVYLFILFLLLLQFAYITLSPKVYGDDLKAIAANRTTVSRDLIANRGTIYDNEGNVLATNVTSYTLIAYLSESRTTNPKHPNHVVDKELTAQKLSEVLDAPYDYIYGRLKENLYQVEFGLYGSKLTELEKNEIENLELPGIDFITSTKRFYPNGQFASYIIGYAKEYTAINLKLKEDFNLKEYYKAYYDKYKDVKLTIYDDSIVADNIDSIKAIKVGSTMYTLTTGDNVLIARGILNVIENDVSTRTDNVIVGELGVESKFDALLKGTNGKLKYQRDLSGYKIPDTPEERVEAIDGKDIYLTIDSSVQRFLESAVKKQVEKWKPEWAIMVAMDAKTGEILGSATSPNFDPNSLPSNMNYQNPLVAYAYEPGSVMKTYTYLCAMNTGNYNGDTKYKSGSIKIGEHTIYDWNRKGWGSISYDTGYAHSSNVGAVKLAQQYLTAKQLKTCLQSYGFGSKTNVELSGELELKLKFNEKVDIDWLSVTYGQGVSTTPIQQLQGLTIIANDGYIIKPHIIKKIVDRNTGEVTETKVEVGEQVASKESVEKIKELMYNTVNSSIGTGRSYKINGFNVIGKTGTAQISENGKYLEGKTNYLLSFAGMFPKDDPEIIIYSASKKPKSDSTTVIAPSVVEVIKNIAKYRNMFLEIEEEDVTSQKYTLSSYVSSTTINAKNTLEKMGMKVTTIGNGDKVIGQYPIANKTIVTGDKVFLLTNDKKVTMPDMKGWARSEVITYCRLANIDYDIKGYGYVKSQNIKVGTVIDKQVLEVELETRDSTK